MSLKTRPVLLYDGHCGLCHGTVRLILKLERRPTLLFAPQQSEMGQRLLAGQEVPSDPETVVLVDRDGALFRSDAVLGTMFYMGGPWRLMARAGGFIPRPIRNGLYNLISKNRHRFFRRKSDACQLPDPKTRERFLT